MQIFMGTMFFGGLAYVARTYRNSLGSEKKTERLAEDLAPEKIAAAAFQMGGWSSLMPMAWDTMSDFTGLDPVFTYRNTGLPSDAIFGNPTMDFFVNRLGPSVLGTARAVVDPSYDFSKEQFYNLKALMPWQTMAGIRNFLDVLANDLPDRSE